MTAPAWDTDLTDIILEPVSVNNWSALGGGQGGLALEEDFFIQGSLCLSKGAWTNAAKGFVYDAAGPWTIPTDGVLLGWALYGPATASLDTQALGGFRLIIGDTAANYYSYYFGGKDTLTFETWIPVGVDPNTATADLTDGTPDDTWSAFGVVAYLPTTAGPTKGNPLGMDALRYGRHILEYTYGDGSPNYSTFALAEATANSNANRWGNIEYINGAYFVQGFHSLGVSGDPVDFRDSNTVVFIRACNHNLTNDAVTPAYNRFEIINAGSNVSWDNIIFQSLGTRSPGTFVHTAGAFNAASCQFIGVGSFSLLSSSVMSNCIFRGTDVITAPGSDLTGSQVLLPTVAANTSALIWNVAENPDGELDGMTFVQGAAAHHAIEFGLTSPVDITMTDMTATGFDVDTSDGATFHVLRDTGLVTINIIGGTGVFTYKSEGATVDIVISPATLNVTARDIVSDNVIAGARVLVEVADGTNFPYMVSVAIERSGATATVTHSGHGLVTGNKVRIRGATNGDEYNGIKTITWLSSSTYTYSMTTTPDSPATGTITSTMILIDEDTNGSGLADDTRTYPSGDQPITGKARQGDVIPYYKNAPISGTVDSENGLNITIYMVRDS